MTIKIKSIPHKYRNKYLRDGSSSGAIIGSSGGGSSVSTGGSGLPYTLDDDGNYVIAKKITVQGDIYADTNIVASGEVSAWGAGSSSSGGTGGGYWGEIQGIITNQTDLVNYIDGKVSEGGGLTSVSWSDIQNKPSTYNPASHGHAISDITSLQSTLDGKSDTAHTHSDKLDVTTFTAHTANTTSHITATERSSWNNAVTNNHTHSNKSLLDAITSTNISSWNNKLDKAVWDKVFYFDSSDNLKVKLNLIGEKEVAAWGVGESSGGTGLVTIVDNLTSTSADAALSANQGRVLKSLIDNFEGGITSVSWNDVQNKPSTFTPSAHGHAISDITNLQTTLDGKSSAAHTHSNIVPIGEYSFDASTLPNSLPSGISNGFVNQNSGYGSYGSVLNVRSYAGGGGTLQLWTPYSPTYGGTSLKWRSGNYDSNNGNSWTGLKTILDSGNYNSYTPTKTGGGASGTWGINVSGNATSSSYPQGFTTKSGGGWGTIGTIGTLVTDWGTSTGGNIQFRERSGQLYVGVDGTFYQREGAYEVIDTSTINNYAATVNHTHTTIVGNYTSNGGQQPPSYFGKNRVGALMMNTNINGNTHYKDFLFMDCYSGGDVGGGVAIGVNRQALGAYIMRSDSGRTAWNQSAELWGTHNFNPNSYSLTSHTHYYAGSSSIGGSANSAVQLQTARNIFGKSFNGTGDIAGQGYFYGNAVSAGSGYANGALQLREAGLVGSSQSSDQYAPRIGFHWGSRFGYSIVANSGCFKFLNQAESGYVDLYGGNGVFSGGITTSGRVNLNGGANIGYTNTGYSLSVNNAISNSWWYSNGTTGWYNASYGGGIYMTDSTYVRVYNGKSFYSPSNILAAGEVTAYSDRRLKSNIKPLENRGILNPVSYEKNGKQSIGFIAQEVQEMYPELVSTDDSTDEKYLSLNYAQLTAVLAAQINDLRKELDELKAKLN